MFRVENAERLKLSLEPTNGLVGEGSGPGPPFGTISNR